MLSWIGFPVPILVKLLFITFAWCSAVAQESPSVIIQTHLDAAEFGSAQRAARQWLQQLEQENKADSGDYATALDLLADSLGSAFSPLSEIQPLIDRSVSIKSKIHGDQDISIANSLNILAIRKFWTGDYSGSLADFTRAGKLEQQPAAPPSLVSATLGGLGLAVGAKGDPTQAIKLHQEALALREKEFGAEHWRTAEALFWLATDYRQSGDLNHSLEYGERAAQLLERTDPNHPLAAGAIGTVASAYRERAEYARAKPLFEKSIEIYTHALGPDSPRLVASYNNYGLCLKAMSDFAAARIAAEQAVRISTTANGPASSITAQTLGNLGIIYQQTGDYPRARQTYETALGILERTLGPEHEGTASVLTSLGLVLRDMGDIAAARPLIERALAIYEKRFGPENPKTLQLVTNLASIRREEKDYPAARALVERALRSYRRTLGPGNIEVASLSAALAAIQAEAGDLAQASDLYRQAITVYDALHDGDSFGGAQARSELAELRLRARDAQEALKLGQDSASMFLRLFGPDYPLLASVLAEKAEAEFKLGDRSASLNDALESSRIRRVNLTAVARTASERQALLYTAKGGDGRDTALKLASTGLPPELRRAVWDSVIRDRALVLDVMAERQGDARTAPSPKSAALHQGLMRAREELANSVVAGPRPKEKDYSGRVALLRASVETNERQAALESAGFRSRLNRERAGFADVKSALPKGSAMAAYVLYSGGYLAFVMRAGEADPTVIPLGPAKKIDALVNAWRAQIDREREFQGHEAARNEASYRDAGSALRRAVWDPVATVVSGSTNIFLIADGQLQLVNIPALPVGKASYLMETAPLLHLLSTERDIREFSGAKMDGEMLAMGRPAFDLKPQSAGSTNSSILRGLHSNCETFSSLEFADLPGSEREAQAVLQIWRNRGGAGNALTGQGATKAAFEAMAPGKRVIHIATHAFFLEGGCASRAPLEDPLLRSGLALTGANRRAVAGLSQDDGILTAEEVASLDLSSAELVVLSGCDTGSGEIRAGEGVLGLRRAFRVAGAQNLVMSLWPVTDDGARAWMSAFYQSRYARGRGVAASVREASLSQLRARRASGQSTHPFYWAGFIAVGGA